MCQWHALSTQIKTSGFIGPVKVKVRRVHCQVWARSDRGVVSVYNQGSQIWPHIEPDGHQIGQIWDFLKCVSDHFDLVKIWYFVRSVFSTCDKSGIFNVSFLMLILDA